MKLLNLHRQAFIEGIMRDTPEINYDEHARDVVNEHVRSHTPEMYNTLRNTYPDEMCHTYNIRTPAPLSNVYVTSPFGSEMIGGDPNYRHIKDEVVRAKINELAAEKKEQASRRDELQRKLKYAIAECTTVEQAREFFPEFVAYLPTKEMPRANLPAIDIVETMRKAGWPGSAQATQPI